MPLACGESSDRVVGADLGPALEGASAESVRATPPKGVLLPATQDLAVRIGLYEPDPWTGSPTWQEVWDALELRLDPSFEGEVRIVSALVDGRGVTGGTRGLVVTEPIFLDADLDDRPLLSDLAAAPGSFVRRGAIRDDGGIRSGTIGGSRSRRLR